MTIDRRIFIAGAAAGLFAGTGARAGASKGSSMYGLIGKMTAQAGQRHALVRILIEGVSGMPGCLSYVVAKDATDPDTLWITEAWESEEAHRASLAEPSVKAAIAKGRPLIAGMTRVAETAPVGGHGLVAG